MRTFLQIPVLSAVLWFQDIHFSFLSLHLLLSISFFLMTFPNRVVKLYFCIAFCRNDFIFIISTVQNNNFCTYVSYFKTSLESWTHHNRPLCIHLCRFLNFLLMHYCVICRQEWLYFFPFSLDAFHFFILIICPRNCDTVMSRSGRSRYLCLSPATAFLNWV